MELTEDQDQRHENAIAGGQRYQQGESHTHIVWRGIIRKKNH